jgi:hypothetical protein
MDDRCIAAFQAGARALLDEVVPFIPADEFRALEEWVERDLAAFASSGAFPPPPSRWPG